MLNVPSIMITFQSGADFLFSRIQSEFLCAKLLCTPTINATTTCSFQAAGSATSTDTLITPLGHVGSGISVDLFLGRLSISGKCDCNSGGDLHHPTDHLLNSAKSVCLRLLGFRIALMEEFLEVLQRSNFCRRRYEASLGAQNSQSNFHLPVRTGSIQKSSKISSFLTSSSVFSPPVPLHFCVAFLPLCSKLTSVDSGLQFDLIRLVFRRSTQLKLRDVTFSMSHFPSEPDAAPITTSSLVGEYVFRSPFFHLSKEHLLPQYLRSTHLVKLRSSSESSSPLPLDFDTCPFNLTIDSNGPSLSAQDTESSNRQATPLFIMQTCIRELELTSGWHEGQNVCPVQMRIGAFCFVVQRSSSDFDIDASFTLCQASYVYSPAEVLFHKKLLFSIRSATWLLEQDETLTHGRTGCVLGFPDCCRSVGPGGADAEPQYSCSMGINESCAFDFPGVAAINAASCRTGCGQHSVSPLNSLFTLLGIGRHRFHVRLQCLPISPRQHNFMIEDSEQRDFVDGQEKPPPMIFIFMPAPKAAMQFGFSQFTLNAQLSPLDPGSPIDILDMLLDNVVSLRLSGLHVACLPSLPSQPPWPASLFSREWRTHPSLLLGLRFPAHWFNICCCPGPTTSVHRWGHLFSTFHMTFQIHSRHISCLVKGLQLELSPEDLHLLISSLSAMLESCQESSLSANFTRPTCASHIQLSKSSSAYFLQAVHKNFPNRPVHCTGHMDDINMFFLSSNRAMIVLRTDTVQWSCYGPGDTECLRPFNCHSAEQISPQTGCLLHYAVCTVGATKMAYRIRRSFQQSSLIGTKRSPIQMHHRSFDYTMVFPVNTCQDLQRQWFWLPGSRIEINMAGKMKFPCQCYFPSGFIAFFRMVSEWTADLCCIEFPYRYLFREVYTQTTSMIQVLQRLHSRDAICDVLGASSASTHQPYTLSDSEIMFSVLTEKPCSKPTSLSSTPRTCSNSTQPLSTCMRLLPDYLIYIKRFILEIRDDPFESRLNDNYMVLLAEQMRYEQQVVSLTKQLHTSGLKLSEIVHPVCPARSAEQRARDYRARLNDFHQEFPLINELFTWTLDNFRLHSVPTEQSTHPDQLLHRMRQLDNCSPWPNLSPNDFCTLWYRETTLNVDCWRFELRDYPKPWFELTALCVRGPLIGAERRAEWQGQHTVNVMPGDPWPTQTLIRNDWPLKFFYDFTADVKSLHLCYGSSWEPTVAWLGQRLEDILPTPLDTSPRLGWWDKVRHLLHGRLRIASERMSWLYSTSFNPYNTTDFLVWQWVPSTVCWKTGLFRLDGSLDVSYHTASKYDGVCQILNLPHIYLTFHLDWLSLGNPLDHHAVKPCNAERLASIDTIEHDSYLRFRGNRLAMRVLCGIQSSRLDSDRLPSCLLYTSMLKFTDKLRMSLSKVARPIRRGPVFASKPSRKPLFGRLLQCVEFILDLPQLELTYWVSYANRTGVHAKTGPIKLKADLRYSIEHETKVPFGSDRPPGLLQSYVMMPPVSFRRGNEILRRPAASWLVSHLSTTVRSSRIRLIHNADLPGQVVQMLLKTAAHFQMNPVVGIPTPIQSDHLGNCEEFVIVPLVHYEQVSPVLIPHCTVRVHIPGRGNEGTSIYSSPPHIAPVTGETLYNQSTKCYTELPSSRRNYDVTHESLTPTHRLLVNGLMLRWTEDTRDLIYTLISTYRHAKLLKKNLSARVTQPFLLTDPADLRKNGSWCCESVKHSLLESSDVGCPSASSDPSFGSMESRNGRILTVDTSSSPDLSTLDPSPVHYTASSPFQDSLDAPNDAVIVGVGKRVDFGTHKAPNLDSNAVSDGTSSEVFTEIPMLARLLKEVDTANFFAYCEEAPKRTNVVDQLHGLAVCSKSTVTARNWLVELVDSQMLLKTNELRGYVLVTAARAKLDALAHPPIWKDAQLLTKNSLVGHLEGMQYYATVGQIDSHQSVLWLPTTNVSDWFHLNPEVDEDTLTGKPEVVGCGRSVGGLVSACVKDGAHDNLEGHRSADVGCGSGSATSNAISLQRMISRCSCQVFYVHYDPADSSDLSSVDLLSPLSFDETLVLSSHEGADTVTLLHHTLNVCTNSLQYHMIVNIVNNLLLYVEPQRKAQYERNRVSFGLMSDSQLRCAILRDQEALRCLVAEQRRLERHLWSFAREVMSTFGVPSDSPLRTTLAATWSPCNSLQPSENMTKLLLSIQYARHLEAQIAGVKSRNMEHNALLSQRLAYYQQLQIQAQRRQIRVAMAKQVFHGTPINLFCAPGSAVVPGKISSIDTADHSSPRTYTPNNLVNASVLPVPDPNCVNHSVADQVDVKETNWQRNFLSSRQSPHPAGVVRRSEVCFEHARWRITENDGQIGLADVELRGFLYTKTHRQDDSGSHWLELGWIRVDSLAPDSFFREVLVPDVGSEQYTGGPILRISCSELPPVGGLAVREAMEISVAPMTLQISKQFYRVMMPYFFPEKSELASVSPHPASCTFTTADNYPTNQASTVSSSMVRLSHGPDRGRVVPVMPTDVVASTRPFTYAKRRFYQTPGLLRQFHRGQTNQTARLILAETFSADRFPSDMLNQSGLLSMNMDSPIIDQASRTIVADEHRSAANVLSELGPLALFRSQGAGDRDTPAVSLRLADAGSEYHGNVLSSPVLSTNDTRHTSDFLNSLLLSYHTPPISATSDLASLQLTDSINRSYGQKFPRDPTSTIISPVDVMRERARQNNVFLYIKIPGFPICLSYKGEKQKNLTDVTRFQLSVPTMEYHNCVWTWLDFTMEVKARIRKQLMREVIRKKFTPRRRGQFGYLDHSSSEKVLSTASADPCSFLPGTELIDRTPMAVVNQEERMCREVEMLLGRHAQLQPPRPNLWNRFRPNR
ncbi:unnamed protein product [Dicrocoelium dendriticum]|nr:unnamed protein product [Dicrocoelium dendriticum]